MQCNSPRFADQGEVCECLSGQPASKTESRCISVKVMMDKFDGEHEAIECAITETRPEKAGDCEEHMRNVRRFGRRHVEIDLRQNERP